MTTRQLIDYWSNTANSPSNRVIRETVAKLKNYEKVCQATIERLSDKKASSGA